MGPPEVRRLVLFAPNWLGDLVMAMPAIADVRRALPAAEIWVAARASVAGLLPFVPGLNGTIVFDSPGSAAPVRSISAGRFDAALLLPNAFRAAWTAWRARVASRWGYRGDGRTLLLTTAVRRPAWPYRQVEYYQRLTASLGFAAGSDLPQFAVPSDVVDGARALLASRGHTDRDRVVVLAPGTAQGTSKQWIPEHVSAVIARLSREGVRCVLAGARGDAAVGARILAAIPEPARSRTIDLIGQTTIAQLTGVLTIANVVVGNDSGATHLAAGLGTRVVATFGPTNEAHSAPPGHPDAPAVVLTHQVWCRPCMLMKACPIDHGCMAGITPERVHAAVRESLGGSEASPSVHGPDLSSRH